MCGRFTIGNPESIAARYGFVDFHDTKIPPRFNIAPSQLVLVVVDGERGPESKEMRWGFEPAWLPKDSKRPPPINARAETLLERPMFRDAVARGRCVILADGFYEWVAVPGQKKKQPMHIRLPGGISFGFAGLTTRAKDGQDTCVIITTAANAVMAPIHHRMPVILDPEQERAWLDSSLSDPALALGCLDARANEQLEAVPAGPDLLTPEDGSSAATDERSPRLPLF
jgi:putative SOS response-associated peptidase YedK